MGWGELSVHELRERKADQLNDRAEKECEERASARGPKQPVPFAGWQKLALNQSILEGSIGRH